MVKILLTSVLGVILLAGLSFFLVWLGEYSKKMAKRKHEKKFQFIDKYFSEMETASEKQMEKVRRERLEVFGYAKEARDKETENIDITRFSGNAAI